MNSENSKTSEPYVWILKLTDKLDLRRGKKSIVLSNLSIYYTRKNIKIPHTVFEKRILCFSSYKNHKLKAKLWWAGARKRKKRAFFVPFILSEEKFFNICVLSQCILYWIYFQNIHTFKYQKTLFHTIFCLFFKLLKAFSVSLKDETCLLLRWDGSIVTLHTFVFIYI